MANKKKVYAYAEDFRKGAVRRAVQKRNFNQSVAAELGGRATNLQLVSTV